MENKREGARHVGSTRRSPPDHHCWVMENKRGESHAGSARCSPRSVMRKKGEREGLGRRSWRLTGERGGHMRRDVDRERRERVRESRFHRGRMRSEESTGAAWNLRGWCGRDRKLSGKVPGSMDPTCQLQRFALSRCALAL
jgi:hypothetical protein